MNRIEQLTELINGRYNGSQAEFARAIDKSPAQVYQWLRGRRSIGDGAARHIEMTLALGEGWLDGIKPHDKAQDELWEIHPSSQRLYEAAAGLGVIGLSNVARALGERVQTVKNWEARGISQAGLLKAQKAFQCNANWIATGNGTRETSTITTRARDPILDDLHALLPEDADVWRAKIRAAAIKARRNSG